MGSGQPARQARLARSTMARWQALGMSRRNQAQAVPLASGGAPSGAPAGLVVSVSFFASP